MTLRIRTIGQGPPVALALDGRLTGDEVAELRRAIDEIGGEVLLDLAGLQFADRPGVSALRELKAQGVRIAGASPYITLLLGEASNGAAN